MKLPGFSQNTRRAMVMDKRVEVRSHASPRYRNRVGTIRGYQTEDMLALVYFEDDRWDWWAWISLKGLKYI